MEKFEEKEDYEKSLEELLKEREEVATSLETLEEEIYSYEESFLVSTAEHGNVVTGLNRDAWLTFGQRSTNAHLRPKFTVNNIRYKDRVFSNSSVKSPATRLHPRLKPNKFMTTSDKHSTSETARKVMKEEIQRNSKKEHGKKVSDQDVLKRWKKENKKMIKKVF
uniref:Chromatin modification-related protein MEAF6 n=1 Tax=Angiostrongylus cantonensis TaxID=6313 RepID=A0A0K0CXP9_ANGCA